MLRVSIVVGALLLCACPAKKTFPPPPASGRCEVDLTANGLFSAVGTGASAAAITAADQLIGGEMATGAVGDFLLQNDQIRVIVQAPGRNIGPNPFGGVIVDADLKRAAGVAGHDQLGKLSLLYQFGRIINVTKVEVLQDGSSGGYSVVAATGDDAVNDYLNVSRVLSTYVPGTALAFDPNAPVTLHATTYYVLSPGESRVRMLTAFCNTGHDDVVLAMGDLFEQGGSTDFFNPTGCTNGLGLSPTCTIDRWTWFGFQGDGIAYGLRGYTLADQPVPQTNNVMLPIAGVIGTVVGASDQTDLLTWANAAAMDRPGSFGVLANGTRTYLRDLMVASDLAGITSQFPGYDTTPEQRLSVVVTNPGDAGTPAVGARIAVISAVDMLQKTLMVADADGKAHADLAPGNYVLRVGLEGHAQTAPVDVAVPGTTGIEKDLTLGASQTLKVTVHDPFAKPLSAKITVLCAGGSACQADSLSYLPFQAVDPLPSNVQTLAWADGTGVANVVLPPGQYEVLVSRGPEYDGFPQATFPDTGAMVDLSTADAMLDVTLAHVVDTTGYMSADLHVHAVNSADSSLPNLTRVLTAAGEGLDVLTASDHDFVTDDSSLLAPLSLSGQLATMIADEISPFDFGHQHAFPLTAAPTPNGGAFDWAGGADAGTLRLDQLYSGLQEAYPGVVLQMNHPRGAMGSLTQLEIDTATRASHADPASFRMDPAPGASADDTKLFSDNFDSIEVMDGPNANLSVMNDWMTFLSTGHVKTATGVSDSHFARSSTVGYGRTWVKVGSDTPDAFVPTTFATALKAKHVSAGNGPFVTLTAQKLVDGGTPMGAIVEMGDTLSVNPAAQETVLLTVDVQAPTWMTFDTIEVYTHASGREATNGVANSDWPANRIYQSAMLDPTSLPLEPVPGLDAGVAQRIHVTQTFTVTPTADTWYVVFVRGSTASHTLFPLVIDGVSCNTSGACTTDGRYAFSFTNPIFIDGDGSGAYDNFPMQGQGLSAPTPKPAGAPYHAMTAAELDTLLRAVTTQPDE